MYYYIYYLVLGTARQQKRTSCATNSTKWFKLLAVTWLRCHRYADSILEDRCVFGREVVVLILAMYGSIHTHRTHAQFCGTAPSAARLCFFLRKMRNSVAAMCNEFDMDSSFSSATTFVMALLKS